MNEIYQRQHILRLVAARGRHSAKRVEAEGTERRTRLIERLGGRPSTSLSPAAFERRQARRMKLLREMLRARG